MRKYEFVERWKGAVAIRRLCRALGVSPSGYWAWRRRAPSGRAEADTRLQERMVKIHTASRATYGAPRIHAQVQAQGERCSRKRVARLMRVAGVAGCHRRRFRTTRRDPARPSAPDLVQRAFVAAAPNQVWVADMTYVYDLRADPAGLPLPRGRARRLQSAGGGLVDGGASAHRASPRRARDGPAASPSGGRGHSPFRPWPPVHRPVVPRALPLGRHSLLDGLRWAPLATAMTTPLPSASSPPSSANCWRERLCKRMLRRAAPSLTSSRSSTTANAALPRSALSLQSALKGDSKKHRSPPSHLLSTKMK
jgi:hypothetical protein